MKSMAVGSRPREGREVSARERAQVDGVAASADFEGAAAMAAAFALVLHQASILVLPRFRGGWLICETGETDKGPCARARSKAPRPSGGGARPHVRSGQYPAV
jgi:hypothetical protein